MIPRLGPFLAAANQGQEVDDNQAHIVHRQSYYDKSLEGDNSAQIIIAKHRNGETGSIDLTFRKEITKFVNKARDEVPQDAMV